MALNKTLIKADGQSYDFHLVTEVNALRDTIRAVVISYKDQAAFFAGLAPYPIRLNYTFPIAYNDYIAGVTPQDVYNLVLANNTQNVAVAEVLDDNGDVVTPAVGMFIGATEISSTE